MSALKKREKLDPTHQLKVTKTVDWPNVWTDDATNVIQI